MILPVPPVISATKPLMRDFIGLNVHTVQFRAALYAPVARRLRDYHGIDWDTGEDPTTPTTFPMSKNGVDWEKLYGVWKTAGYVTEASAQFGSGPADRWTDASAFAYGEAFARFFGPSNKALIEAVEIGNEPANFTEAQYRKTFKSMAKGVRKGDPKLKIATCAVAVGKGDKYSKDVASLEGLESLIDVLNVHTYAFVEGWPTWRRSYPEDPSIRYLKQVQEIVDWRNVHAPGRPVWVTEFGYDATTRPNKTTGDFAKWVGNTDEQQAQYIVRSYLRFSAMDIDRAYLYWFNDDDTPQLHGSSGLTRNYVPKPSFYAVAHLQKTLGSYRFRRVLRGEVGGVYAYEYASDTTPGERVVAVWSATGSGKKATIGLPLVGEIRRAEAMPLQPGRATPVPFTSTKGKVTLTVGESPVYLWVR